MNHPAGRWQATKKTSQKSNHQPNTTDWISGDIKYIYIYHIYIHIIYTYTSYIYTYIYIYIILYIYHTHIYIINIIYVSNHLMNEFYLGSIGNPLFPSIPHGFRSHGPPAGSKSHCRGAVRRGRETKRGDQTR
jgi:hypothetical protein